MQRCNEGEKYEERGVATVRGPIGARFGNASEASVLFFVEICQPPPRRRCATVAF
jgi:hypothetical protein